MRTLFLPKWIILPDPRVPDRVCVRADTVVVVENGKICYVGPHDTAPSCEASVRLPDHVLMPGLVNAHTHAAMTLFRGIADDLPLDSWLTQHIWPREAKVLSDRFVHDGAQLAAYEMLRGGTTCCADHYFFGDASIRALRGAGMRVLMALGIIDIPTPYGRNADDYLHRGIQLVDEYKHDHLVQFAFAPHAPYSVSDATLKKVVLYAGELDLAIHTHLHETAKEVTDSRAQYGITPIQRLARLGVLACEFVGYHGVHIDATDRALLADAGAHLVHCPTSNMKLASGIAPVHTQRQAGINVALGTDGAASNNQLNLWQEMRHAALLAKVSIGDASTLAAAEVLDMATRGGARALGLAADIGTIEVGKCADLIAVDLNGMSQQPLYDPISQLVYAIDRECVAHVWVNGEQVVRDGVPLKIDVAALRANTRAWQGNLQ